MTPLVLFADAVELHLQPAGQGSAELGLSGARKTVDQDVDARLAGLQRTRDQAFDVVAAYSHMLEVRPFEFTRGGDVEQQAARIRAGVPRGMYEPLQSVDRFKIPIIVDGHQARPHERHVGCKAGETRANRQTEKIRYRTAPDSKDRATNALSWIPENVIDNRLDG